MTDKLFERIWLWIDLQNPTPTTSLPARLQPRRAYRERTTHFPTLNTHYR